MHLHVNVLTACISRNPLNFGLHTYNFMTVLLL